MRSFPASAFEDALVIAQTIQTIAAGQTRVRRLTLFEHLNKSPDSSTSRQLITNSSKYGLTRGGYQADFIELTEEGALATGTDVSPRDQLAARFALAITSIPPFSALYEHLRGNKLPTQAVLRDFLLEQGLDEDEIAECIDTFIVNAKFLGLLRTIAGAERLVAIEQLLEDRGSQASATVSSITSGTPPTQDGSQDWSKICFYISPIGVADSEQRQHSDLFLGALVEPALAEFGMRVVRADQIGKAGMISAQILEHIAKAKLVIADLSFHNPNVFYELSLRHAVRLPTVQLIRSFERIPFDLEQIRTIRIDTTSIYTLVPSLQTYRSEIATQVRQALADPDAVDNPISVFFPSLRIALSK